jgi:DNA helicase II / ATP-dependent DNA helicase PcrA
MEISPEAAKAIKEEELVLERVKDSLGAQLQASTTHFQSENARARELTSELVAATREEDKALLASDEAVAHAMSHKKAADIEVLRKLQKKPYFARFMVSEKDGQSIREHEYKLGFAANPDCRIIDWRKAPISRLYYNYKEGDEYCEQIMHKERSGVVTLRNAVDIEHGRLHKLSCRHGSFVHTSHGWRGLSGALRPRDAHASAEAYSKLPDVLSLITAEQFGTITTEAQTAILIQGIAGSGKTTVALHRLAWLLHEENSGLKPVDCVVIVLSQALKTYIANTLPSINVLGVRVITFHEWTAETIRASVPRLADGHGGVSRPSERTPHSIGRVLRSMALLKHLEEREARLQAEVMRRLEAVLPWSSVPAGLRKLFEELRSQTAPALYAVRELGRGITRGLSAMNPAHPGVPGLQTAKQLLAEQEAALGGFEAALADLLHGDLPAYDETKLIDREIVAEVRQRLARNQEEGVLDRACDALLVRLVQLRCGAVHRPNGTPSNYGHMVVDEVQDLGPIDLAAVIKAVRHPSQLTLVGDVSQKIDDTTVFPGWRKLRQYWDFKDNISQYITLTVSHRSTLPIMRLAEHVQQRSTVTEGRGGRIPIWFFCPGEKKGIRAVMQWLNKALEKYPGAVTAVICPDMQEAKYALGLLQPSFGEGIRLGDEHVFSFEEGIVVTDIRQAKGLEFLNVLLWNPILKHYPTNQHGRNLLYTAITRAEENLCLVTWGKPAEMLPDLRSPLVRGVDMRAEEEEGS